MTDPLTTYCPLCSTPIAPCAFAGPACASCGLSGPPAAMSAVARLRRETARAQRKTVDAYRERTRCVAAIAWLALRCGLRAGLGRHTPDPDPTWDPEWLAVVYVELPSGQVSWHVPDACRWLFEGLPHFDPGWDGHTLDTKHQRLDELRNGAIPHEIAQADLRTVGDTLRKR